MHKKNATITVINNNVPHVKHKEIHMSDMGSE